jgi:polyhydroxyalkanoate synthesis regulator protein
VLTPNLVKRYARTRLYDTETLRYVTLSDLMLRVSKDISFVVIDAETGEDITRILLSRAPR